MAIAWWYVRRKIRKRGDGRDRRPDRQARACRSVASARSGIVFAWMLVLGVIAGAVAFWWWRRQQHGGDDWGDWEPAAPVAPPPPSEPAPPPASRAAAGPRRHVSDGAGLVRPSLDADPGRRPERAGTSPTSPRSASTRAERALPGGARGDRSERRRRSTAIPARGSAELVTALAERHGVPAAQVIVAAGSRRADRLRLPGGARSG